MALRMNEDTEFNDALRAQGILPPKSPPPRSPSPELEPTTKDRFEQGDSDLDEDDLLGLEDDLPASVLDKYREARMAEYQAAGAQRRRFGGGIGEISRQDYTRDVTEASKQTPEDVPEGVNVKHGTGVVCFLYNDAIPESRLMRQHLETLSHVYPSSKFVAIQGNRCIPDYPDKNIPTLLIYRNGQMTRQLIGLGERGLKTSLEDIEGVLVFNDGVDYALKDHDKWPKKQDGNESEEDDDD